MRFQLTNLICWLFSQKHTLLDVWRGSEYLIRLHLVMFCVIIANIWWDISNSNMTRIQSEFLWIFQKNWQPFPSKSLKRQRLITFIFIFNTIQYPRNLRNNIYHSKSETHQHFFIEIPILGHILIHSVDKTNILVVTVELIWLMFFNIFFFNFVPTPKKSLRFTRFKVTLLFCLVCVVYSGHVPFLQLFVFNYGSYICITNFCWTNIARMLLTPKRVSRRNYVK